MKKILIVLAVAALAGCQQQPPTEASQAQAPTETAKSMDAKPVAGEPGATLPSPEKPAATPTAPAKPKLGPKTTAASFEIVPGCALAGDSLRLAHFNVFGGYLQSDFPPAKITFRISGQRLDEYYPAVKLLVHLPDPDTAWKELETLTLKDKVERSFDLPNSKPGRYAFRVVYHATDPPGGPGRPTVLIDSVELER